MDYNPSSGYWEYTGPSADSTRTMFIQVAVECNVTELDTYLAHLVLFSTTAPAACPSIGPGQSYSGNVVHCTDDPPPPIDFTHTGTALTTEISFPMNGSLTVCCAGVGATSVNAYLDWTLTA